MTAPTRAEVIAAYATEWHRAALTDPAEYGYGDTLPTMLQAETVAERMAASVAAGRADIHGSPVLRRLARRYGIPYRHADMAAFVRSLADPVNS